MREITLEQLDDLIKVAKGAEFHQQFKEFAEEFYGPNAYKCIVHTNSEYNDSTYDDEISAIAVYDKNDKELTVNDQHPDIQAQYAKTIKWARTWKTEEIVRNSGKPLYKLTEADSDYIDEYLKCFNIRDAIQDVLQTRYSTMQFAGKKTDYYDEAPDNKLTYIIGEPPSNKLPRIFIEDISL